MKRFSSFAVLAIITSLLLVAVPNVRADGTETLGTPSIEIKEGSGIVSAGVGLASGSGSISLTVPTGTIQQVLLYWEGHGDCGAPGFDPNTCKLGQTIKVGSTAITGQLIGGPTNFYNTGTANYWGLSYRADITDLGLIAPGSNSLSFSISEASFDAGTTKGFANGASVLVIYDDGNKADIAIRDGNDNAFLDFEGALKTTVPQTFNFTAENVQRTANLTLFVGSVLGPYPGNDTPTVRPNAIKVTINGTTTLHENLLKSVDGPEWDRLVLPITIPAGASSLTVEVLSQPKDADGNWPASLSWVTAALSVPKTPASQVGAGTPGFWMNHPDAWPVSSITVGGVTYSKTDAIAKMKAATKGDVTFTMFAHLVAAKLNVASGANASCINSTIADADTWMATYGPVGSGVESDSAAWKIGEPLKNTLDDYNNGLLCALSRDKVK